MNKPGTIQLAHLSVLSLADIKAAMEAFERGEVNVFDSLNAIVVAVEAYQAAVSVKPTQAAQRKDAA